MLAKINKLTRWQAAITIAILGFVTFSAGLFNSFLGDDNSQVVDNPVVHSLANIKLFFEGGTFYVGQGLTPLQGYYRPLMTTVFSFLYSLFGTYPFYFHLFQLLLCIGSSILLYLLFRKFFTPVVALVLSLIFLIYPINSQNVYAIAHMQDVLFFFFGVLALWLLIQFSSLKILWFVAACLLLSLLSKETGVVFIIVAAIYLFWFDPKKRLFPFIGTILLPLGFYIFLRINAVGLNKNPLNAPIDTLSLTGRLMTAPSIILFYITKIVFPWKLASGYYWVYPSFSVQHVLIPLLVDSIVVAFFVYVAFLLRKKRQYLYPYIFFAAWAVIGLLPYLQLIPLDMTVSETWLYFSMAGVLGVVGTLLTAYKIQTKWILTIGVIFILFWGFRTYLRGHDWNNQYILAYKDIGVSKQDYVAQYIIAYNLVTHGKYSAAKSYALSSISICPSSDGYNDLGLALTGLGNYDGAAEAYRHEASIESGQKLAYENLGGLTLVSGNYNSNRQFLVAALNKYPQDSSLWEYLAILDDKNNDNADAKVAISQATKYGNIPHFLYTGIMNNQSFTIKLTSANKVVTIQL